MKPWTVLFALAICLQAVSGAPTGNDTEVVASGEWPPANVGPEHVKSWECAVPAFTGQKRTDVASNLWEQHKYIQGVGKLTNQPDGKWGQVSCMGTGGFHWRNTGTKPKTVTGAMISYYVQLVRKQTNFGPEGGIPGGLVGYPCGVAESVLGTIKMKDDWEVNVGSCLSKA